MLKFIFPTYKSFIDLYENLITKPLIPKPV